MKLTLTEKNNLQYDLRNKMWKAQQQARFCQEEIMRLNHEYKYQDMNLYEEMFGSETPLGDEVYGG
jgi:hypothetical protein